MRILNPVQALSALAILTLLAGCSSNSPIAPKFSIPQGRVVSAMGRIPVPVGPIGLLKVNTHTGRHFASFNACPQTGTLVYVSDYNNSVIDIFSGASFHGQAPCGQLTSSNGLNGPEGMFVKSGNLYVANTLAGDVRAYHRGAHSPFKTYTDPGGQFPVDVTIAQDNTVIASNIFKQDGSNRGSISTFKIGGAFVGNFTMINDIEGLFVTVQKSGTVYFNDLDTTLGTGLLWTGSCPAGACGTFTKVPAATQAMFPGGLRSTRNDSHLTQIDQMNTPMLIDYTLPAFSDQTCPIPGVVDPVGDDINFSQHHFYWADAVSNNAGEMTYATPLSGGCVLKGTVPGNAGGMPIGVAVDRPESL